MDMCLVGKFLELMDFRSPLFSEGIQLCVIKFLGLGKIVC